MSVYQQVLDIAHQQSAALKRGELDSAIALLDERAELLAQATAPSMDEVPLLHELLRLDRDLSSAIRERMVQIRDETLKGQQGTRALNGYGRRMPRQPMAVDQRT
jgi:hypothetical protein